MVYLEYCKICFSSVHWITIFLRDMMITQKKSNHFYSKVVEYRDRKKTNDIAFRRPIWHCRALDHSSPLPCVFHLPPKRTAETTRLTAGRNPQIPSFWTDFLGADLGSMKAAHTLSPH